jgi:hypothetical protein
LFMASKHQISDSTAISIRVTHCFVEHGSLYGMPETHVKLGA